MYLFPGMDSGGNTLTTQKQSVILQTSQTEDFVTDRHVQEVCHTQRDGGHPEPGFHMRTWVVCTTSSNMENIQFRCMEL